MIFTNIPASYFIWVRTIFTPETSCSYRFGLSVCGRAKLFIDGKEVIDFGTSQPKKTDETPIFNRFTMERFADLDTERGVAMG
jgi:beta-glucosidase